MINPHYQMGNFQPIYPDNYNNRFIAPPNTQPSMISGKVVDRFEDITVSDVPISMPQTVFVKSDFSEIQVRKPDANGQIKVMSFSRITETVEKTVTLDDVMERLDKLEKTISRKQNIKKEADTE